GHARDLTGEGVELVHHGVDGVLELQDFSLHVDGDLAGKVALGHGGGDFGDVSNLSRQGYGHGIHWVGEMLPGTGDTGHVGLTAQAAFRTYFARDAGDLACEGAKLFDHGVEGFFELENFTADVHGDFAGKVAAGDGRCDFGDVAHLAGE